MTPYIPYLHIIPLRIWSLGHVDRWPFDQTGGAIQIDIGDITTVAFSKSSYHECSNHLYSDICPLLPLTESYPAFSGLVPSLRRVANSRIRSITSKISLHLARCLFRGTHTT